MAIPLPHLCAAAIAYTFLSIPMCAHVGAGPVMVLVGVMDTEAAKELVRAESALLSADVYPNVVDLDAK